MLNPINGDAEGSATNHGQVEGCPWSRDAAAIFAGRDIQSQAETIFYSPVTTIG
jgi:hypothetical protein